ncbi:MAG: hypothetical protein CL916_12650 [Deltaproteobacteria bacterium]|nr:hypothetical protein [Deltaproteobacteria bacterium]
MRVQFAIPATILLGTTTTMTGCADPIVGTWTGTSIEADGETITIPYSYEGVDLIESLDLTVDADLTGSMSQVGYGGEYTVNLEATNNGGGSYTITPTDEEDAEDPLNCTLTGSELACTDGDTTLNFSKGAKE